MFSNRQRAEGTEWSWENYWALCLHQHHFLWEFAAGITSTALCSSSPSVVIYPHPTSFMDVCPGRLCVCSCVCVRERLNTRWKHMSTVFTKWYSSVWYGTTRNYLRFHCYYVFILFVFESDGRQRKKHDPLKKNICNPHTTYGWSILLSNFCGQVWILIFFLDRSSMQHARKGLRRYVWQRMVNLSAPPKSKIWISNWEVVPTLWTF